MESFSIPTAYKIFHVTVLSLIYYCDQKKQMPLQCLSTDNMVFSDQDKILIKSLYLKKYAIKRLTDEFPEKNWTKYRVNKLLKTLRDTGTVDITTKRNPTTAGSFQSHPHFAKK